ncbi:PocR ligand-binding domain-containing protein [Acetobacterium tundrae]|uniref:histidine kinase n=1 Tax=Acetobacterium tundrae TaxID=132932 RepID=A0ABR6WL06_9FIRM|nr:PocR ligand-binding domain-containing protein [Acetobacterium tundrae]MBC3797169.1 histidine kinase [Acetobacterium tundrae]
MRVLLKITDIIDVEVLQKIQDSFSDATGLAAVTVDYKGNPITKYSNFSEFCNCVRKDSNNRDCCYHSDAHGGIESARSGKPSIYLCHGGLVDVAVPIMVKGNYLGAIMAGQVKIDAEEMKRLPLGAGHELTDFSGHSEITELYEKAITTTLTQVKSAADLLYTIANYLVEKQMIHIIQEELHNKNIELMEEVKLRSEVEASLKEADLKALQAQINPHFLFNVLNTIGRLALLEGAEKTQDMIYAFSDMMRYTLKKEKNNVVSLKEEIEHAQNYLSIQKMRLGNRLNYSVQIDEMTEDILCPFMTIQPFVENAIIHAIEPNAKGGTVKITAEIQKEGAILKVIDDGKGIPKDQIQKILEGTYEADGREKNTGIGINNANKRLMYYYGVDYGVEIKSELEQGTEITIKIPRKSLVGRGL